MQFEASKVTRNGYGDKRLCKASSCVTHLFMYDMFHVKNL